MSRTLLAAFALLLCAPLPSHARSLDREGTVSILPTARLAHGPAGLHAGGAAPGLTFAFGYKPSADLRVGIDLGGSQVVGRNGGGRFDVTAVPLLLALDWILMPNSEIRPVLQAAAGKEFLAVRQGSYYRELTPTVVQVAAGVQADVSDSLGVLLDAGYLLGRATDPRVGRVDGGGPFVRLGITFRFEPTRGLGQE
jgi:hypothetical protein